MTSVTAHAIRVFIFPGIDRVLSAIDRPFSMDETGAERRFGFLLWRAYRRFAIGLIRGMSFLFKAFREVHHIMKSELIDLPAV
ncbi:hypothetical protein [Paraburkholderia sp.]|uniref:hypothetical protein n=1 Tax=Paraburkholderia sp. TaxID=1926495 RepID=UPI0023979E92|nr:hypothetical protein [Paraburkholderia sp.]MDE1181378.1 hypothetical protein [Paraburkholderia sp.]